MNEKPVKVSMEFNEALRRIAKTPKGLIIPEKEKQDKAPTKRKTAPTTKKGRG